MEDESRNKSSKALLVSTVVLACLLLGAVAYIAVDSFTGTQDDEPCAAIAQCDCKEGEYYYEQAPVLGAELKRDNMLANESSETVRGLKFTTMSYDTEGSLKISDDAKKIEFAPNSTYFARSNFSGGIYEGVTELSYEKAMRYVTIVSAGQAFDPDNTAIVALSDDGTVAAIKFSQLVEGKRELKQIDGLSQVARIQDVMLTSDKDEKFSYMTSLALRVDGKFYNIWDYIE